MQYVLDHLNPDDRFNIISFATGTQQYAGGLRPRKRGRRCEQLC